jgi:hypothetical protein
MQKWQQWESASEADWGLAVEREAVIRPLAAHKRLCTEDVEEAAHPAASHVTNTSHNRILVYIQTGAIRMQDFHRSSSCAADVEPL